MNNLKIAVIIAASFVVPMIIIGTTMELLNIPLNSPIGILGAMVTTTIAVMVINKVEKCSQSE